MAVPKLALGLVLAVLVIYIFLVFIIPWIIALAYFLVVTSRIL